MLDLFQYLLTFFLYRRQIGTTKLLSSFEILLSLQS